MQLSSRAESEEGMERLTTRTDICCEPENDIVYYNPKDPDGLYNIIDLAKCVHEVDGEEANILLEISNRLAAYEDSGLTPEDIEPLQRENKQLKAVLKQARAVLEEIEKCCEINIDDGYHACQRKCREVTARARFFRGVIDELERSEGMKC